MYVLQTHIISKWNRLIITSVRTLSWHLPNDEGKHSVCKAGHQAENKMEKVKIMKQNANHYTGLFSQKPIMFIPIVHQRIK